MSAIKNNINYLLIPLILLPLAGCGPSPDLELTRYINSIKQKPARPIEPLPKFEPLAKFTYPENDNRRSPFKPIVVQIAPDKLAPNTNRVKQPLENFPLDALKFVGVLKQTPVIWALISLPGGEIVRVKPGDYMGKDFGKIIKISDDSLKLEETVQVAGKWKKKITTFNLNSSK